MRNQLILSDNIEAIKGMPDNSVDSVVTDPPYGLGKEPNAEKILSAWLKDGYLEVKGSGFMGKSWDAFVPQPLFWKEVIRVLKPGGHVLSFFGARTYDWGVMAMRLAGFEIRDCLQWVYGSGFPKSMDISKAIDKEAGAVREVVGTKITNTGMQGGNFANKSQSGEVDITTPTTPAAKQWDGWGTALKPANEPIVLARKPIEAGLTIADNIQKWGVGGLNIDATRIGDDNKGRFPSNLILDEVAALYMDSQSGVLTSGTVQPEGFKGDHKAQVFGKYQHNLINPDTVYGDSGGASRFFYCAKTSQAERNAGLLNGNDFPTVKPLNLMKYLVRMITPAGGACLEPHLGSGSTVIACVLEGFDYIGIEREAPTMDIAKQRISYWTSHVKSVGIQKELF